MLLYFDHGCFWWKLQGNNYPYGHIVSPLNKYWDQSIIVWQITGYFAPIRDKIQIAAPGVKQTSNCSGMPLCLPDLVGRTLDRSTAGQQGSTTGQITNPWPESKALMGSKVMQGSSESTEGNCPEMPRPPNAADVALALEQKK